MGSELTKKMIFLENENAEMKQQIDVLKKEIEGKAMRIDRLVLGRSNDEKTIDRQKKIIIEQKKRIAECEVYESFYNTVFFGNRPVSIIVGKPDNGKTQI